MKKIKLVFNMWWVLLLSVAIAVPASAIDFTTAEKLKLKQGRTIVKMLPSSGKKGFYGGSGYSLINAPVDEVWKVLTDWASYTKMFPNTEICTPVSKKGNKTLLKIKIGHPVANVRYHVETIANEAEKSLYFNLVTKYPHDIDSLTGYWRLFPQPEGRTLAAYVASIKAPVGIITIAGDDLANRAVTSLLKMPGSIKRWIEGPNGKKYK